MKAKTTLHFYAKASKANPNGLYPIYVRLTINGQRFEYSTKKYIDQSNWSKKASKVKGNNEEARTLNSLLDFIKNKVNEIQFELMKENIPVTIEEFKKRLKGNNEHTHTLIPIFKDHNRKIKELLGKEYAPGTLERYETSLKHTQDFLKWKYNVKDISIKSIDLAFINDYEFYLRTVRNCANNTAVKYIRNFGKIIKICMDNEWLDKNPMTRFKSKMKEVERVYLTENELQNLIDKELSTDRLSLVRDIFVFSCFTGLAYIDTKNLTKANIHLGIDGDKWIYTNRQKTKSQSRIPILPVTQSIIDKYKDHPHAVNKNKLLPLLSNQKMNAYLKEIAAVCNINKELTFHIARHTFATTVTLTNGVPIESVSKMLGHKNLRTTQHYAKVLDSKVSNDMQILKTKYTNTLNSKAVNE